MCGRDEQGMERELSKREKPTWPGCCPFLRFFSGGLLGEKGQTLRCDSFPARTKWRQKKFNQFARDMIILCFYLFIVYAFYYFIQPLLFKRASNVTCRPWNVRDQVGKRELRFDRP